MDQDNELTEIERDFEQSWINMERFFASMIIIYNYEKLIPIYRFIIFHRREYNRKLRVGQSMDRFVLSRSQHHGLRRGQARIIIHAKIDSGFDITYSDEIQRETVIVDALAENDKTIVPEVKALLDRLLEQPID